jgi:hypothetical protein
VQPGWILNDDALHKAQDLIRIAEEVALRHVELCRECGESTRITQNPVPVYQMLNLTLRNRIWSAS